MSDVVTMPDRMTAVYVTKSIESFIADPPDTEYQKGFCQAMCVIGEECLSISSDLITRARDCSSEMTTDFDTLKASHAELLAALKRWLDAVNDKRAFEHHQPDNTGREWKRLLEECDFAEDAARAAITNAEKL